MRWIKLICFLSCWAVYFVRVALTHLWISLFGLAGRWHRISRVTQSFTKLLSRLLNIRITLEGDGNRLESGGCCIVSNHMGYLDGIVLGSLFPVTYVSKKEVRRWPLIGQWTALCGTIYIDRQRKDRTPILVEEIAEKLRGRANILLFPEGTSTNGEMLLPFQSVPFAAPLRTQATIVPVTLAYKRINGEPVSNANRDQLYWYGDMEFAGHFWNLLGLGRIEVTVKLHPAIDTSSYPNNSISRKQLSQACYDIVAEDLKLNGLTERPDASVRRTS